jgi:hypothetical protein
MGINKSPDIMFIIYKEHSEKTKGEFSKNYGKHLSEETKLKISRANKGKLVGELSPFYGIPKSKEQIEKVLKTKELRNVSSKGENNSMFGRRGQNSPIYGEKNGRWKGGVKSENEKIRQSVEYKEWRNAIFARDNYTCQCCGEKSGDIEAHHIDNFSDNVDKRFDIDNGITLCKKCHNPIYEGSFHNVYGTFNNNKEQLDEYIRINKKKV